MSSWMEKKDDEPLPERRRDARWLFLALAIIVPTLMLLISSMFKAGDNIAEQRQGDNRSAPVASAEAKAPGQP